jgi:hypothetical protein
MSRHAMPFVFVLTALMTGATPSALLAFGQEQTPSQTSLEAQAATMAKAERPDAQPPADSGSGTNPGGSTATATSGTAATAPEAQPAGPPAPAPVPLAVTSGAEINFYSKYMWRGWVYQDAFSAQPTYWVKFADALTVSSWMNFSREQVEGPLTEHDLTVDYTKAISPKITMSAGWINYVYPALETQNVSNEFYGGFAHASYFNPAARVYVDVHSGTGVYLNLSAGHTYAIGSSGFAATPTFSIAYNHKSWIDESTWNDANFGVKLTVPTPIKGLFLTPQLYYSKALTDKVVGIESKLYGGIGIVTKVF